MQNRLLANNMWMSERVVIAGLVSPPTRMARHLNSVYVVLRAPDARFIECLIRLGPSAATEYIMEKAEVRK